MFPKNLKNRFLAACAGFFLFVSGFSLSAQEAYEFVDRDIHEILYALSLYTGISISADDTVSGKANFRGTGADFDESFDAFLLQSRLYVEKTENRWTVSRIRFQKNNDFYSLDAFDATPMQLFEKTAIQTGFCVTYDSLPTVKVSLHTGFCKVEEILKRITDLCMGFSIEKDGEKSFHIARNGGSQNQNGNAGRVLRKLTVFGRSMCRMFRFLLRRRNFLSRTKSSFASRFQPSRKSAEPASRRILLTKHFRFCACRRARNSRF